jgi:outer membrane PBP1 activator LpoA protein
MKNFLKHLPAFVLATLLAGCGDSGSSSDAQTPDPATQPEAQAILFERTIGRAKSLIEAKDYKKAQEVVDQAKTYKLTPEQQTIVDKLQAQIPKTQ